MRTAKGIKNPTLLAQQEASRIACETNDDFIVTLFEEEVPEGWCLVVMAGSDTNPPVEIVIFRDGEAIAEEECLEEGEKFTQLQRRVDLKMWSMPEETVKNIFDL